MASQARKMRHPYISLIALIDDRETRELIIIVRILQPNLVEEAPVYLLDYLKMSRKDTCEQGNSPLLKGFRQNRMVRI